MTPGVWMDSPLGPVMGPGGVILNVFQPKLKRRRRSGRAGYADNPMDLADASLLWLADQLDLTEVITLDRGFSAFRTPSGRAFEYVEPMSGTNFVNFREISNLFT